LSKQSKSPFDLQETAVLLQGCGALYVHELSTWGAGVGVSGETVGWTHPGDSGRLPGQQSPQPGYGTRRHTHRTGHGGQCRVSEVTLYRLLIILHVNKYVFM